MKAETKNMEESTLAARNVYFAFIENMQERANEESELLTEKITETTETETILALQKEIKKIRRKSDVLSRLLDGIRPLAMQDIINSIAEQEVRDELKPMFDVIEDMQDALGLTVEDIIALDKRMGAHHE